MTQHSMVIIPLCTDNVKAASAPLISSIIAVKLPGFSLACFSLLVHSFTAAMHSCYRNHGTH